MTEYLALKLEGVMQAWGKHTFEGQRLIYDFPTRSAITGLLGACLGIPREKPSELNKLGSSFAFAVRHNNSKEVVLPDGTSKIESVRSKRMQDYHTIKDARKERHSMVSHSILESTREYLLDASFTVVFWNENDADYSLNMIKDAVRFPKFTPYLGRKSCPLSKPLYLANFKSNDVVSAFAELKPSGGIIYSEAPLQSENLAQQYSIKTRDVPLNGQPRQFGNRVIYVFEQEG